MCLSRDTPAGDDGRALWRVAAGLFSARDATPAPLRVAEAARALAHADAAALLLYDRTHDLFVPDAAVGLDERWLQRQGLEGAHSLALQAIQARDIIEVLDVAGAPDFDYPLLQGGKRPGSVCVVPLEAEETVVGVLSVYHTRPRAAPLEYAGLRVLAALGGAAITNARVHDDEQRLRARLEALDESTRSLSAELALDRVLQRIVEIAAQIAGARYGALGVVGDDGYLTDFVTTGIAPDEREKIGHLPRGHGLLGVLIRLGEPLRVPDMARDPRRVGFPPDHPPMTSLLGVPVRVHDELVGDLYLTDKIGAPEFSDDDQRLIEMLAAHAGIAIENANLYAQVRDLTTLRERERIGRDLHDGIIQDLYAATLRLEDIGEDVPDQGVRERITHVAEGLSSVIGDVRAYIQGLRVRGLEGRMLSDGMAALVRDVGDRAGFAVTYEVAGSPYRLPDALANTLLQTAREALSNAHRHAGAAHVTVGLTYEVAGVTLTIGDDGRGFDPQAARGEGHHGLRNLRARAEEAGGTFSVRSAPGVGTTITVSVPANRRGIP